MKDAVRLLVYFAATILIGAFLAPLLFWAGQFFAAHGLAPSLAGVDFERYVHRALQLAAIILLWPLLRALRVGSASDLALEPNAHWKRDLGIGFLLAVVPLLGGGGVLIACRVYSFQPPNDFSGLGKIVLTTVFVPLFEEAIFRGLVLGVLLRTGRMYMSILVTSALYSIVHFFKSPDQTLPVTWASGFDSMAHSFGAFADPMLFVAGFATLFLIGLILADARIRTHSLWLAIGLHAGWVFASREFERMTDRQFIALPWIGPSLLVGIVPLGLGCLTWLIMRAWLKRYAVAKA